MQCSLVLCVREGVRRMTPPVEGIINEQERGILAVHGLQLAESNRRKLLDDWFYMYIAFTSAQDYLWVSYLLADESGKAKMPSQLIKRLKDMFPASSTPVLLQDPDDLFEADRFITTPFKTRSALTAQLARYQNGYPIQPIWHHVLDWYIRNHSKYEATYIVLQSLYYQNTQVNLSMDTVYKIYSIQIVMRFTRFAN